MATTIKFLNHTKNRFNDPGVNVANLKVMLRNGTTFNAANTRVSDLDGTEVHGNNWTEGGEPIANAAFSVTETDGSELTGDNISKTATGGSIGPTDSGYIIETDGVNSPFVLFELKPTEAQTAGEGTPFIVEWTGGQIVKWTESA